MAGEEDWNPQSPGPEARQSDGVPIKDEASQALAARMSGSWRRPNRTSGAAMWTRWCSRRDGLIDPATQRLSILQSRRLRHRPRLGQLVGCAVAPQGRSIGVRGVFVVAGIVIARSGRHESARGHAVSSEHRVDGRASLAG